MVKRRSIVAFILLSVVTLGIYPLISMSIMTDEINSVCEGDGRQQMSYILAWLLGIITLGIYPIYWIYTAISRLEDNEYRYRGYVKVSHSASSFLIWYLLGFLIAIGPLVAMCFFLDDVNQFADIPMDLQPAPYTKNNIERAQLSLYQAGGGMNPGIMAPQQNNQNFAPQPAVDPISPTVPGKGYSPRTGKITGVSGMYNGVEFPAGNDDVIVMGVDPSVCSIVITENGQLVSRKHCSIRYNASDDSYYVTDYSTNGTYVVDEFKLEKGVETQVNRGAVISLGNFENGFRLG